MVCSPAFRIIWQRPQKRRKDPKVERVRVIHPHLLVALASSMELTEWYSMTSELKITTIIDSTCEIRARMQIIYMAIGIFPGRHKWLQMTGILMIGRILRKICSMRYQTLNGTMYPTRNVVREQLLGKSRKSLLICAKLVHKLSLIHI